MTPQQIEALKLALEALELCNGAETVEGVVIYTDKEITAIKETLAQQSGWRKVQIDNAEEEAWRELEKKAVYSPFIISELWRLSK
tara:strand:- start:156 stop:410 length:255 start_codon:yes stop_codon:yes gene_type:complete